MPTTDDIPTTIAHLRALARRAADHLPAQEAASPLTQDLAEIQAGLADLDAAWREQERVASEAGGEAVRDLAGQISDPVVFYDNDMRLQYRNLAAAQVTGIPDEQMLGKTFAELYPDLAGGETHRLYLRALETQQAQRALIHWTRPRDAADLYFDLSLYPTGDGLVSFSRDVTERVRNEQARQAALAESEARFRIMADGTPVIIWVTNADGSIAFINQAYTEFFGVTLEQVKAGGWQVLVHPEDDAAYTREYLECARQRKPFRARGRVRAQDGQWHWIYSHGQPRFSETGEYLGMAGSSLDITERVQAEDALQGAYNELVIERNRLLAVMESLPLGIAILDNQGGVVQVNKGYAEVWGGSPPEVHSVDDYEPFRAWWVDSGEPLRPEEWASAQAIMRGETVTGQYLQIQRFDGKKGYVLNSGAPVRDADGCITGSAVAIMDITRMVEAETALSESQERFRVALNSVPLMVYTCDCEQRYTWIYHPLRGFHAEGVMGRRDDEIIGAEAAADLNAAKQEALDSGQGNVREVRVPLNGEDTWYILTSQPIRDRQGQVIGLTCSAIDITRQKKLEAEQQEQAIQIEVQRRLMDQRERDRHAIARDLHDGPIQTLSSTLFQLAMMKEVFPDPALLTELEQFRLEIKNSIQELRDVLNELRPPALMQFGFVKVAQMYIEDVQNRYNNLHITAELADEDGVLTNEVHLTLFRIFQAAMNNIIRHSTAEQVRVSFSVKEARFLLEVEDDGRGFDSGKDYSQLTRQGHFGLVGMRERAEAIGGELRVRSAPGQGTRITVSGPVNGRIVK